MSSGGPVIRVLPVFVQDEQLIRKDSKRVRLNPVPTHQPSLLFHPFLLRLRLQITKSKLYIPMFTYGHE